MASTGPDDLKYSEPQDSPEARYRRRNPDRLEVNECPRETDVFAIPDIHGDKKALCDSLYHFGAIDANDDWVAGDSVVQFLGDYIDRGSQSLETLRYLNKLRLQAEAAGGRIDFMVGNHEGLLIQALFSDKRKEDLWVLDNGGDALLREICPPKNRSDSVRALFIDDHVYRNKALTMLRRKFLNPKGEFSWLLWNTRIMSQVDDVLYVHGGISPDWAAFIAKHGVETTNLVWLQSLEKALNGNKVDLKSFLAPGESRMKPAEATGKPMVIGGPVWADLEKELAVLPSEQVQTIARNLKFQGINVVVVGHRPVSDPVVLSNFKEHGLLVIGIDTYMSQAYCYGESGHGGMRIDTTAKMDGLSRYGSSLIYDPSL